MQIVISGLLVVVFAGFMLWDAKSAGRAIERRILERLKQEATENNDNHNG